MQRTVLVVDDEKEVRFFLENALSGLGCKVRSAKTGEEALLFEIDKCPLIFLDLILPDMHGFQVCEKLKQLEPKCYIIAMTGYITSYRWKECREAGFDYYIEKPINFSDIERIIQNAENALDKI